MKAISEEEARLTDHRRWSREVAPDVRIERLRMESWANLRRRQRKIAVFKAIAASGLLFLICGSAALIAYALEW